MNYIIASYPGLIENRHLIEDPETILDRHLQRLLYLTKLQKINNFETIKRAIIIVTKPKSEVYYPNYYKKEYWSQQFTDVCIELIYLDYQGINDFASYDQWLQAILNFSDSEYHLLIEDDYVVDSLNFVEKLKYIYNKEFPDNIGFLATYCSELKSVWEMHASISNGLISQKTINVLENPLEKFYHLAKDGWQCQIAFSRLITWSGLEIKSLTNYSNIYFWESSMSRILDYSIQNYNENIFLPIQLVHEPLTFSILIVTAIVDIGREKWNTAFSRSISNYLSYMKIGTLRFNFEMVIFADPSLCQIIEDFRLQNEKPTIIISTELKDCKLYENKKKIETILQTEKYQFMRKIYNNCPELTSSEYLIVVNNKIDFIKRAIEIKPNFDFYAWVDIGYGHGKYPIQMNYNWPIHKYLYESRSEDKITINFFNNIQNVSENPVLFFEQHIDLADGGIMFGKASLWLKIHNFYYDLIEEMLSRDICDDDQYNIIILYWKYKDLFNPIFMNNWEERKNIILFGIPNYSRS